MGGSWFTLHLPDRSPMWLSSYSQVEADDRKKTAEYFSLDLPPTLTHTHTHTHTNTRTRAHTPTPHFIALLSLLLLVVDISTYAITKS